MKSFHNVLRPPALAALLLAALGAGACQREAVAPAVPAGAPAAAVAPATATPEPEVAPTTAAPPAATPAPPDEDTAGSGTPIEK